jgi:hypothetical protein
VTLATENTHKRREEPEAPVKEITSSEQLLAELQDKLRFANETIAMLVDEKALMEKEQADAR